MEIQERATGRLTTVCQFKTRHPNTSFPKQMTPEILDSYGYDPVLNGPAAEVSGPYETSVRDGVEEIDGQWYTKYVVGPVFTATKEATAAEQQVAYEQRVDDETATRVRRQRDKLLAETDWVVTKAFETSTEIDTDIAEYRQALRDVTDQPGFPHEVVWPELA